MQALDDMSKMEPNIAPPQEIHIKYLVGEDRKLTAYQARSLRSKRFRDFAVATNTTETNEDKVDFIRAEDTIEVPTVNPHEMAPTDITAIVGHQEPHKVAEIHVRYGVKGMLAAQFSVTDVDSDFPTLTYAPGEGQEREIFPDSHEYHIRMQQFRDFVRECESKGFTAFGQKSQAQIDDTSLVCKVELLPEALRDSLAKTSLQTLKTIFEKGLSRPLSR